MELRDTRQWSLEEEDAGDRSNNNSEKRFRERRRVGKIEQGEDRGSGKQMELTDMRQLGLEEDDAGDRSYWQQQIREGIKARKKGG